MAPSAMEETQTNPKKSGKKHKREKSEHKKRAREEDAVIETTPRKSKKPKSDDHVSDNESDAQPAPSSSKEKKSKKEKRIKEKDSQEQTELAADDESNKERKKSKKHKKHQEEEQQEDAETQVVEKESSSKRKDKKSKNDKKTEEEPDTSMMDVDAPADEASNAEPKEKKKKKKEKSKDKKKKRATSPEAETMDVDIPDLTIRTKTKLADLPSDPEFPFFIQTTSLYVPFYPVGFDKPLTNVAAQHLDPLLNHYSPVLKGVLLKYSNLNLSDRPAKASPTNPPTDQTPALLYSVDEYAVGFGWLTFDAHIFKPARGKWMEGILQLQSEGHIGVVCWNKFNASIEAKRLPKGWKWIDTENNKTNGSASLPSPEWDTDAEAAGDRQSESDKLDGEELEVVEQMHSTGYWVDEKGRKVAGKLRFRIKNFDVGLAGDYGYLSIEGTFLDDEAERRLTAEERENERKRRARQNPFGLLRPLSRRVPEFSVTKFGKEEQEEDSGQRTVYDKGSRLGTPDN